MGADRRRSYVFKIAEHPAGLQNRPDLMVQLPLSFVRQVMDTERRFIEVELRKKALTVSRTGALFAIV